MASNASKNHPYKATYVSTTKDSFISLSLPCLSIKLQRKSCTFVRSWPWTERGAYGSFVHPHANFIFLTGESWWRPSGLFLADAAALLNGSL